MRKELNIVICGLGGQGVVMSVRILGEAAFAEGLRVLTTDVPPVTQRFECIYSYVRIGEVYAETFPEGEADLLLGLDAVQGLKVGLAFASETGVVLLNERIVDTMSYSSQKRLSLMQIKEYFAQIGVSDVRHLDASQISIETTAGIEATNMVMLGAAFATGIIPVSKGRFVDAIRRLSPTRAVETNFRAFEAGTRTIT
jgi:indolepyruvate ferredoxin oxidoreductase beta subunit